VVFISKFLNLYAQPAFHVEVLVSGSCKCQGANLPLGKLPGPQLYNEHSHLHCWTIVPPAHTRLQERSPLNKSTKIGPCSMARACQWAALAVPYVPIEWCFPGTGLPMSSICGPVWPARAVSSLACMPPRGLRSHVRCQLCIEIKKNLIWKPD
jgi:hypothetical protein